MRNYGQGALGHQDLSLSHSHNNEAKFRHITRNVSLSQVVAGYGMLPEEAVHKADQELVLVLF